MFKFLFAVALFFVSVTVANADIVFTFSGGTQQAGQGDTYGFQFIPVVNISVDSLGFYDLGSDGLSADHPVGIWDATGTLLSSTIVTTGNSSLSGPVINGGQFRFTPIPAIQLSAGTTYVFGAQVGSLNDIWYSSGTNISNSPSLVTVSSSGVFDLTGNNTLVFPTQSIGNTYAAGSFTASPVPEPSTLALLGLSALSFLAFSKRLARS
jgi:hypothetical protein